MKKRFAWHEVDVIGILPVGWQAQILNFATASAVPKTIVPTSVTSRESAVDLKIPVLTVGGARIKSGLPWLYSLYENDFRDIGQRFVAEPLATASDVRYAVNLNVQRGADMRYECHVDSNPLEGLLYITTHSPGSGGELVVSQNPAALGPKEIDKDCARIYPKAGTLVFFDARQFPHYVAPLKGQDDVRVVVAMNYYTPSCPESSRPKDLNRHLGLE
jgi:hypothetical protein